MTTATWVVAKVDFKPGMTTADIDKGWTVAQKYLTDIGQPVRETPDSKKILAAMTAAKKGVEFETSFDKVDDFKVTIKVAGKIVTTMLDASISDGSGDQKKARIALEAMVKKGGGKLFTQSELNNWDKAHPDPDKVAQLQVQRRTLANALAQLKLTLKQAQDEVKKQEGLVAAKTAEIDKVDGQLKTLGVTKPA